MLLRAACAGALATLLVAGFGSASVQQAPAPAATVTSTLSVNPYRALFVGTRAAPLAPSESVTVQAIERVAVDPIVAVDHAGDRVLGRLQAPGHVPNRAQLTGLAREIGATRALWWSVGPDPQSSTLHVVFIRECAKAAC